MDIPREQVSDDGTKVFVGGLGWNTSKEQVQEYFERFGPVSDVIVLRNPSTGQSRGFGFVTFTTAESAKNACNMKSGQSIDGKDVDVKPYSSKIHEFKRKQKFDNSMKVFIGGIPPGMKDEEIIDTFRKFGSVLDFTNMMDETRTRSRGFGFLTFEKPESIQRALTEHWVTINGKQLEVKPAQFNAKRNQQAEINSVPPYNPYYDPYSSGMMSNVFNPEEDYYNAPWGMSDPNQNWNQPPYEQHGGWQQRPRYQQDYNNYSSVNAADSHNNMMHSGMNDPSMMDGGYDQQYMNPSIPSRYPGQMHQGGAAGYGHHPN